MSENNPNFSNIPVPGRGYIGIKKEDKNVSGMNWNKYRMTVTLIQYDKDLKVTKENKLSGGDNAYSSIIYSSLEKIGDKIWFIYVEPAEKNNIGNIMAVEVNPLTLEVSSPKVLAASKSMGLSLPLMNGLAAKKVLFKYSPDRKKVLLFVGAGKEQFYLSRLDEQLNVVWGKNETIAEITDKEIQSEIIDNAGIVYLSYVGKVKTIADIVIFKQTGTPLHKTLTIENAWPAEVLLLPSKQSDSIYIAGTYFDQTDNLAGVFKSNITTTGFKLAVAKKSPFPSGIVEQFANDGWGSTKGKKYGIYPQFSSQLVETGEGISMVAEFRSEDMTSKAAYKFAGGILNIYFDNKQTSFSRIPKYRVSAGSTMGDSYFAFSSKGKTIIFYNDNEENLNRDIALKPLGSSVYKNAVLVGAVIEADGTVKRTKVIDLKDQNFMGLVEDMKVISPSVVQIPVQKIKSLGGAGDQMMTATITVE
ncbi:hypothetical protein SAMN05428988_3808 [Chitinophaga sp. YR573]|nr:hypothetical protein SAMN05428988_3808 [Chitinophaga sp. YR573]